MFFYRSLKHALNRLKAHKRSKYLKSLQGKGLKIGKNVEILDPFFIDPSHCYLISIGNKCTICPNVRIIAHDASTFNLLGFTKFSTISIKDNCFIGDSAIILPGVEIGPNSIVGAGSVVNQTIPAGVVAAGNPARIISSLEKYLLKFQEMSQSKPIFDKSYHIQNLDSGKIKELIASIGDSFGFIR